ncbi:MAG: ATPase [Eubacteriales bacterium]|nr:ATPase [Eubacteriales bacterium]
MKIAVLSGKGGTGKTLVSVNIAAVAEKALYIDCDVEEPNGHLFFKPEITEEFPVTVPIPVLQEELCTGCRICTDFCRFQAMAFVINKPLIFEEVCHSCAGCVLLCPQKALKEINKCIGTVQYGFSQKVQLRSGMLKIGEASGVAIIKKLLENRPKDEEQMTLIDCPPGSACIVMESIKDADICVLVAEPTLFGVHNLKMVCELVEVFKKPYGVILNKCMGAENPAEDFCKENGIPIWGKIVFDKELGEINAEAKIAARENEKYQKLFLSILQTITAEGVQHETTLDS